MWGYCGGILLGILLVNIMGEGILWGNIVRNIVEEYCGGILWGNIVGILWRRAYCGEYCGEGILWRILSGNIVGKYCGGI